MRPAERRAVDRGDTLGAEQLTDEILVILDHLARRRRFADAAGNRGDVNAPSGVCN